MAQYCSCIKRSEVSNETLKWSSVVYVMRFHFQAHSHFAPPLTSSSVSWVCTCDHGLVCKPWLWLDKKNQKKVTLKTKTSHTTRKECCTCGTTPQWEGLTHLYVQTDYIQISFMSHSANYFSWQVIIRRWNNFKQIPSSVFRTAVISLISQSWIRKETTNIVYF